MLKLAIPKIDLWDEKKEEFYSIKPQVLQFEHSLVSISKWESKWHKPFLSKLKKDEKTKEQVESYYECMCMTSNVDPLTFKYMPQSCRKEIENYISDSMTATWFSEKENQKHSSRIVTSELIYCWMISLGIPVEFQKWHLNRLMTLIRVCNSENSQGKKMSQNEIYKRNRALNEARRKAGHTRG